MAFRATTNHISVQEIGWVAGCAVLTAVGARLAIPLPYTPVPMTWQVPAVLFAGLVLGARSGGASQFLYLLAGLAGAPVFAFGAGGAAYLLNAHGTGGYLLSYPLAAWAVGAVVQRAAPDDRHAPLRACAVGLLIIYGIGSLWLALWLRLSPAQALLQGAGWFLVWDAVKALLAILAARGALGLRGRM